MGKTTRSKTRTSRQVVRAGLWTAFAIWLAAGTIWMATANEEIFGVGAGRNPSVTADHRGGAVVTWEGAGDKVVARRVGRDGSPLGDLLRVSQGDDRESKPVVAPLGARGFVVAWERRDDEGVEVAAARLRSSGRNLRVDDPELFELEGSDPAIGSDDQERIVVAWTGPALPGNHIHLAQRFGRDGSPLGDLLRLGKRGPATPAALAVTPAGEFLVAWEDSSSDIRAALVSRDGSPLGDLLRINSSRLGRQSSPAATAPLDGDFTVVWERQLPGNGDRRVYGRRVSATGSPLGDDFLVSLSASVGTMEPAVSADAWGRTLVTWTHQAGGVSEILSRQLDLEGAAFGAEVVIALPVAAAPQLAPAANDSDFVVVWEHATEVSVPDTDVNGRFIQLPYEP